MPRLTYLTAGIVSFIALAATIACSHNNTSSQGFVEKASVANEFEIESSKVALSKSKNAEVKAFAQRMISEHSQTGKKLKKTVAASGSSAMLAEGLDAKHQKMLGKLQNTASGKDFDKEYLSMQKDAHKEAVCLFKDYAKNGSNPTLRNFAADTLPHLKDHLKHVKKLKENY